MSAASFLGIAGLVALSGFDGLIYSIGFLVGWPIVMFLIAEPLRNLGRYTFTDVVAMRLRQTPVRIAAAIGSLAVVSFYLIAQMVGAGNLVRLLFGIDYATAVVIVGVVMLGVRAVRRDDRDDVGADREGGAAAGRRVSAGGARARAVRFQSADAVCDGGRASTAPACSHPGRLVSDPLDAVSLGLSLMLGTAGLPHILMRFYTVPDAKTARESVTYATAFIGFFYLLTFVLGFGAMVLVGQDAIRAIDAGGNMAAPLLAEVVGGHAVPRIHRGRRVCHDSRRRRGPDACRVRPRCRTICGCTSCGTASADEREQFRVAAASTLVLGALAIVLGIAFQGSERRIHGGSGVRHRRQRQLSRRWCCRCSGGDSRPAARRRACWSARHRRSLLIYFSPTVQVGILGNAYGAVSAHESGPRHDSALVRWWASSCRSLTPEHEGRSRKFTEIEHRLHLGVD